MHDKANYVPVGDRAVLIQFGNSICQETNRMVRSMTQALEKSGLPGILGKIPAYTTLLVMYDPKYWNYHGIKKELENIESKSHSITLPLSRVIVLPVLYGGEYGSDLHNVCAHTGLTPEDVIAIHSGNDYLIYMLGFTPGFPYLGGMDERLATPRLKTPRIKIPEGSVGIAGSQTGVYPISSPGGWQLIGRTPVKLFEPSKEEPIMLKAGDYLRFQPITEEEYKRISDGLEDRVYNVQIAEYK